MYLYQKLSIECFYYSINTHKVTKNSLNCIEVLRDVRYKQCVMCLNIYTYISNLYAKLNRIIRMFPTLYKKQSLHEKIIGLCALLRDKCIKNLARKCNEIKYCWSAFMYELTLVMSVIISATFVIHYLLGWNCAIVAVLNR